MDRRDFLKKGAYGIAGAVIGGGIMASLAGLTTSCVPGEKRVGLQLYSLRDAMGDNPESTLEKIAAMGYKELETANYNDGKVYGYTPADFRALVEELGMKVSSTHTGGPGNWRNDEAGAMEWWKKSIADHKAMGCRYIVIPGIGHGDTVESVQAVCDYFNKIGAMCKAEGLTFGYHNHSGEFKLVGDKAILSYMIENTSSDVNFELDVYWAKQGGQDPVEYINKYAGRFPLLHIKDDSVIGESGKIDFEPIFAAAYKQGMKDYYVEVEQYSPYPPEVCVERSFTFLDTATYVK
jgi:sugar phosphate isomerase/epimerase